MPIRQVDFEVADDRDRESSLNRTRDSGTSKARSRGSTGNPEMMLKLMLNYNARPDLVKYASALKKKEQSAFSCCGLLKIRSNQDSFESCVTGLQRTKILCVTTRSPQAQAAVGRGRCVF
jgi:hypothetical protein